MLNSWCLAHTKSHPHPQNKVFLYFSHLQDLIQLIFSEHTEAREATIVLSSFAQIQWLCGHPRLRRNGIYFWDTPFIGTAPSYLATNKSGMATFLVCWFYIMNSPSCFQTSSISHNPPTNLQHTQRLFWEIRFILQVWMTKHHSECTNVFSALLGVTGTPAQCSEIQDESRAGRCRDGCTFEWNTVETSPENTKKQDVLSASEGNEALLFPHTIWWLWNFS